MSKMPMGKPSNAFNRKRNQLLFEDRIKRTEKDCLVEEDEDEIQCLGESKVEHAVHSSIGKASSSVEQTDDGLKKTLALEDGKMSKHDGEDMINRLSDMEDEDPQAKAMLKTCSLRRLSSGGTFHQFHQVPQGSNNSLDKEYTSEWAKEARKRPTFFISSGESDSEYEGSSMRSLKAAKTFTSEDTLVDTLFVESTDQVLFAARYSQGRLAEVLPVQVVPAETSVSLEMGESVDSSTSETSSSSSQAAEVAQGGGRRSSLYYRVSFLKRLRQRLATATARVFFSD